MLFQKVLMQINSIVMQRIFPLFNLFSSYILNILSTIFYITSFAFIDIKIDRKDTEESRAQLLKEILSDMKTLNLI